MNYYKITVTGDDELIAIIKDEQDGYKASEWGRISDRLTKILGTDDWWWLNTTQVEFETYQAFGIKEIPIEVLRDR